MKVNKIILVKNSHGKSALGRHGETDATGGGSANDGIITVSLNYNHPNPGSRKFS